MNHTSPTHHLYLRTMSELRTLIASLRELREVEDGKFEWECGEAIALVGQTRRYLGKPGEVLYCNWTDCLHDPASHDTFGGDRDLEARAIPIGEGVPWFKGRVHDDCALAMRKEQEEG